MRISRGIGSAVYALVLGACGSDVVARPVEEAIEAPPPAAPVRPHRSWIGQSRGELEMQLALEAGASDAEGWTRYGEDLRIRYDLNIVIGIATRVPEGLGCTEAAKWMGFPSATLPASREGACEWPGSAGHRLGHGHTGRMDPETGVFQVQLGS